MTKMYLTFCMLYFINIITFIESLEILTSLGPIRGKMVDDETTGAYYYSFEGIPYAEPPVGKLRFKPPVQKLPWYSVHDATKPGYVCPQIEIFHLKEEMNEDCLNFNIYTPAKFRNNSYPVMFYIHDGDFKLQSGKAEPIYGPQLFILNYIVVVTMNYRLGALGFLSLCNEEVSGNAGVKDILQVLKIVYKNIQRFGGDPKKITVMGNGAGAAIAQFLMLTNHSNDLFQNVILHCASVLSTKFTQIYPRQNAVLLAQELGLDFTNDDRMLEELSLVNAFDIVEAQEAMARKDPQRGFRTFSPFKPSVEIACDSAIITKPPIELIKEGALADVPMFIGFNNQEGLEVFPLLRSEPEIIDKLNENFELCLPADIEYPYGSQERRNLAKRIREFYFRGSNISFVNIQSYINLISDSQFVFAIDLFVKMFKEIKSAPVYYYVFETDGEINWFKNIANITYPGAAHDDDIGYPFLTTQTKSRYKHLGYLTKKAQNAILYDLKHFLYYGAPTPNPIVHFWPEAGSDRHHLRLDFEAFPTFQRPLPERMDFWTNVYEEYFNYTSTTGRFLFKPYFCTHENVI